MGPEEASLKMQLNIERHCTSHYETSLNDTAEQHRLGLIEETRARNSPLQFYVEGLRLVDQIELELKLADFFAHCPVVGIGLSNIVVRVRIFHTT